MTLVEASALAGTAGLAFGGLLAAWRGRLTAGLTVQAVSTALLGACGAAVLLGDRSLGAGFRSEVAPALGLDPLSGFFLLVLAITGVPALVFARPYLAGAAASRAVGALTAAFLLAMIGLPAARDVVTFLAFWELMTLVPAAAILATRRDDSVRAAVFAYLAITHLGGAGVWVALLTLAAHGASAIRVRSQPPAGGPRPWSRSPRSSASARRPASCRCTRGCRVRTRSRPRTCPR